MQFPQWVEEDPCYREVVFADAATDGLRRCVGEEARRSKSKFYEDVDSFKAALTEVRQVEESLRVIYFRRVCVGSGTDSGFPIRPAQAC